MNNGQVCGAQSRILVSRKRYDEVVDALGDARRRARRSATRSTTPTQIGPLVAERQRDARRGLPRGGQGRGRPRRHRRRPSGRPAKGWYVEPTVFADVDNSMKIAQEEIFGPVLSVIPYDDEDNAVKIANDSDYGLCGSVWTADVDARRADRGPGAHRCGRDQLVDDPRLQQPVRRVQEVGHRPRARPRRHRALHRAPDDHPPCRVGHPHVARRCEPRGAADERHRTVAHVSTARCSTRRSATRSSPVPVCACRSSTSARTRS